MSNEPVSSWKTFDAFIDTADENRSLPVLDSDRYVSYRLEDLWPTWQEQGRCWGVGNHYFFGTESDSEPTMNIKQVRQASKLCDVCPVFRECLTFALEKRERYGVWAGTSGRVRRTIFSLIDAGVVEVEEVVEDYCNGRRSKYTGPNGGSSGGHLRRASAFPDRASVRAEAVG